ncbi:MAG: tyrosine--tRNA ligase [Candidatus Pacebacteria bacterium]|nr:tyrosine--tRNA ligase [Candidatus Paceibacterota bacterium]
MDEKIEEILNRGTERIIDRENLKNALLSGNKLRIKLGIDPTGPLIHLGRATQLWKLKAFQDLGHQIVLIVGDFTAQIGDPSDKPEGRKGLDEKIIKANAKQYLDQFSKVLNLKKVELRHNSEWLKKVDLKKFLEIANNFSVQQLIHRRNFFERWKNKEPISLSEICYPLMQGYDSVMIKADVELGGYDQLFNLKMGRIMQRLYGQKPQDIITLKMLDGLDGRKMSTSWGNVVNMLDKPNDMYGKLMSMKDDMIYSYYELCSQIPSEELLNIKKKLEDSTINPRDIKAELAKHLVELYNGSKAAEAAQAEFDNIFKNKQNPTEIRKLYCPKKEYNIIDLIVGLEFASSKSEAKRLIEQGGVRVDGEIIKDTKSIIQVKEGLIVQAGRLNFAQLTLKELRP